MLICKGYDDVVRNKLVLEDLDNSDYKKIMTKKEWMIFKIIISVMHTFVSHNG